MQNSHWGLIGESGRRLLDIPAAEMGKNPVEGLQRVKGSPRTHPVKDSEKKQREGKGSLNCSGLKPSKHKPKKNRLTLRRQKKKLNREG